MCLFLMLASYEAFCLPECLEETLLKKKKMVGSLKTYLKEPVELQIL